MTAHMIAIALAVVIDRIIGDPRWLPHPVVGFGKLIAFFDKHLNYGQNRWAKGFAMLALVLFIVVLLAVGIVWAAYSLHIYFGVLVEAWLISTTIAAKGLKQAADEVKEPLQNGNLDEARLKLSYIVGRDTDQLNEAEITRGTVETVAENTSDGVTAPLFFALIGGAPLALLYRAINTCDSMVGYQNDKYGEFGFASAKCDDLFNWIPSRLTSIVMIAVNQPKLRRSKKACWEIVKRDAPKHPSPNSGWGEAAVAALLGIQLGGMNTYKGITSNRAKMGDPLVTMSAVHIEETNAIMLRTTTVFSLILIACGGVIVVLT
ncbi:adenosylcobinamide-phosphate synthase CbiB [Halalkalibacter nanhaiisediminis]|uniref:Cobalamin biosynthesis protein CobD n=1 Tax=Halalkalibacter nanhaiisediminis TaxID=688079 RepID=A0A562QD02_9BACI|nr:adenosylcobinamide-phosphate synthase CbiB [Halalkalibacter nanhaiisediminis]TWI54631.1 adenosylcobinamide-phosphate synthase [Halalkalibacter nanhaiisediminis]